MSKIRILIADDHAIIRQGLETLINSKKEFELVGEAENGEEVIQMAKELNPDVILMDIVMPKKNGIDAITEITNIFPDARILVLTTFDEDDKVFPAIKAGALGYMLKDASPENLVQAIKDVHNGLPSMHPNIARMLYKEVNQVSDLPPTKKPLTEREVDVLKLVAFGMSDQEIAEKLVVSRWTIHSHVRNILNKLHLANRTQAALYALKEGIADFDG